MNFGQNKSIFIFLLLLSVVITPAIALEEIVYSPFTDAGSFSGTSGRQQAFEYDNYLYVIKNNNIYMYDMLTWEYKGSKNFSHNIYDRDIYDNTLYINQDQSIEKYTIFGTSFTLQDTYDFSSFSANEIKSFDISSNQTQVVVGYGGADMSDGSYHPTNVVSLDDMSIDLTISNVGDIVRFSYDDEVVFGININEYNGGTYAYATSNGAQLFEFDIDEGTNLRSFSIDPEEDRFLTGWSGGFDEYDVWETDFSTNSPVNVRNWKSYIGENKKPRTAFYSTDGDYLMRTRDVDGYGQTYLHDDSDGSLIGSFNPAGSIESKWAYLTSNNGYVIVGSDTNNMYVLATGIQAPLITNVDVSYDGEETIYSGAINDIGDAFWANCTIEYKEDSESIWQSSYVYNYTNESEFPSSFQHSTFLTQEGETYNYKVVCDYETTDGGVDSIETREKTFTAKEPPFNPFDAILNNLKGVIGLVFLTVITIGFTRFGISNPLAILAIVILTSFVFNVIGLFSLTMAIFITIIGFLIGLIIYFNGGDR